MDGFPLLTRLTRLRRQGSALPEADLRNTWQIVSLLLEYPSDDLMGRLPALRAVVDGLDERVAVPLRATLDHLGSQPLAVSQTEFVETFDHTRRCCLYLSYFAHGDTRKRGVALVQFKQAFRASGVELLADELPDHLCVVLEFGATVDREAAWKLLNDHRAGIEMLRLALEQRGSGWHGAVAALCATLPALDGDDEAAVARLIQQGPPREDVGLDTQPYALDPRLNPHPMDDESDPQLLGTTIPVGAPK